MKSRYNKFVVKKDKERVVGEVRQSQLLTSFCCGAIVDFVDDTVMIAGTDSWNWVENTPDNSFILYNESLQSLLNVDYFVKPKVDTARKAIYEKKSLDIPAYRFPETLYCVNCNRLLQYRSLESQSGKKLSCFCSHSAKNTLVASRFVAICEGGHIEDFPYELWVHKGMTCPKDPHPKLKMFHVGKRSGLDSLYIKCESCGEYRGMQHAFSESVLSNIKGCSGGAPWLEKGYVSGCGRKLKTALRTETNVYFPATVSALSIPPYGTKMIRFLESYYSVLSQGTAVAEPVIRHVILPQLGAYTYEEVIASFERLQKVKQNQNRKQIYDILCDEYRVLTSCKEETEEYHSHEEEVAKRYQSMIRKVVAVDKLTENVALIGFTRSIEWSGSIDDPNLAPLSESKKAWYPAVQLNGEGIFLQFDQERLQEWALEKQEYYNELLSNLKRTHYMNTKASEQYIFLHTFAHLLIRQLSNVCGYSQASLKEKIYSTDSNDPFPMAGVLIYTASTDADGSLGGLVEQAQEGRLEHLIDRMLEDAQWCASDPICRNSSGNQAQGVNSLNYAACYHCALLPETACEFHNVLLDRTAVLDLLSL